MNIFILEDDDMRVQAFIPFILNQQPTASIYVADNVEEAKKILMLVPKWDCIFLDHDLGGDQYVDSNNENTGYQIAKFIKINHIKYTSCIIHSHNPAGAANMKLVLEDAIVMPFGYFIKPEVAQSD